MDSIQGFYFERGTLPNLQLFIASIFVTPRNFSLFEKFSKGGKYPQYEKGPGRFGPVLKKNRMLILPGKPCPVAAFL